MNTKITLLFALFCNALLSQNPNAVDYYSWSATQDRRTTPRFQDLPTFHLPFFDVICEELHFSDTLNQRKALNYLNHGFSQLTTSTAGNERVQQLPWEQRATMSYGNYLGLSNTNIWAVSEYHLYDKAAGFLSGTTGTRGAKYVAWDDESFCSVCWSPVDKNNPGVPLPYRNMSDNDFGAAWWRRYNRIAGKSFEKLRQEFQIGTTVDYFASPKLFFTSTLQGIIDNGTITPAQDPYRYLLDNRWVDFIWKDTINFSGLQGSVYNEYMTGINQAPYIGGDTTQDYNHLYSFLTAVEYGKDLMPNKKSVPFQRLRYCANHFYQDNNGNWQDEYPMIPFKKNMAQCVAILPIFFGADALWWWDSQEIVQSNIQIGTYNGQPYQGNLSHSAAAEDFMYGLYRLSKFGSIFQGNYERVRDTTMYVTHKNQLPYWRGIRNGNRILIAATNPLAPDNVNHITPITVSYTRNGYNWSKVINLRGKEVFLDEYDMNNVAILPNVAPTANNDNGAIDQPNTFTVDVTLNDTDGDGFINKNTVDLNTGIAGIQTTYTIPNQGTYTVNSNGILTFAPLPSFVGTSSISYAVTDNQGAISNTATVSVVVNADPFINTVVAAGGAWKYWDRGSLPATDWNTSAYNDGTWLSANAEFGYGDGDEVTLVDYGINAQNKYITTYFRKNITIGNIPPNTQLHGRIKIDDGAVVYINGQQIFKDNLPATVNYTTYALDGYVNENNWKNFTIASTALQNGSNTIAVEMHQSSPTSSDLSFDMEILANSAIVGLTEISSGFSIYPNPAKDILYIQNNGISIQQIGITNAMGQVVIQNKDFNNSISTSTLAAGVYYLQITTTQGVFYEQFIVTK